MKTITVTREELEEIYRTMSVKEAIKKLGVTMYTFYTAIDAAGIPRKASPYKEQVALKVTS